MSNNLPYNCFCKFWNDDSNKFIYGNFYEEKNNLFGINYIKNGKYITKYFKNYKSINKNEFNEICKNLYHAYDYKNKKIYNNMIGKLILINNEIYLYSLENTNLLFNNNKRFMMYEPVSSLEFEFFNE